MEQWVVIHPEGAFSIDFTKVVKVELANEGLESGMAEEGWQGFGLEAGEVGDAEGFAVGCPL